MNRQVLKVLSRRLVFVLLLLSGPLANADIVYPARLQVTETAPGLYDVFFVLPVIQGKILKAQAVFPEFCSPVSDPFTEVDAYQKKMRWQIQCEAPNLIGRQVGIDGLLGSQVDIILEITTLDGRTYQSTLSPAQAFYTIPPPPEFKDFIREGTVQASRFVLLQWGLALLSLCFFLVWLKCPFQKPLLIMGLGLCLGHYMALNEWILVPTWAGPTLATGIVALISAGVAFGKLSEGRLKNGLILLGIVSIVYGAGFRKDLILSGYTPSENLALLGFSFLGFFLGAGLLLAIVRQIWIVVGDRIDVLRLPASRLLSGLASGVFIWELTLFWQVPSMIPSIPLLVLCFALALLLWTLQSGRWSALWMVLLSAVAGYGAGLLALHLPGLWIPILGILSFMLISMLFDRPLPDRLSILLFTIGAFGIGNDLHLFASENLSYPLARSVFFLLLIGALIAVGRWFPTGLKTVEKKDSLVLFVRLGVLLLVVLIALRELASIYQSEFESTLAGGTLPLPILSILLLAVAFLLWPRRKKIHEDLEVRKKSPAGALTALFLALLCLPVWIQISNPWYTAGDMDSEMAHNLMENRLWNTYRAFNLTDEEQLFEQLNENLEEGLLDHVYLDSRRRLTMGLREGSKVTVREVSLGNLGSPIADDTGAGALRYPATWTVTAQVKHLKHIHYRKNKYTGTIGLKSIENAWKISEITLTSEDRQVIASGNL